MRQGWSLSFVTQYDVELVHEVEGVVGHQLAAYDMPEKEVLKGITKVPFVAIRFPFHLKFLPVGQ